MATISKFYLHAATTTNTGTMPSAFVVAKAGTGTEATNATTNRVADDTIGVSQTSATITSAANTTPQYLHYARFVSAPLAAQTFATADGLWTFSYARSESNLLHDMQVEAIAYCWRPSTGLRVGTGQAAIDGSEPLTTSQETASQPVSWASGPTTIQDGDILVFEFADTFSNGMAVAYTSTFYYDGTTEASTTSCATFVTPPAALTLYVPPARHPNQFDPIPFVAPGRI